MSLSQRMLLKLARLEKLEQERANDRRLWSQAIVAFDREAKQQRDAIGKLEIELRGFLASGFTERLIWLFFGR